MVPRPSTLRGAVAGILAGLAAAWLALGGGDAAPRRVAMAPVEHDAGDGLDIRVLDELGAAVPGARVAAGADDDGATDATGRVRLAAGPGEIELAIAAPGFATRAVAIAIAPGVAPAVTVVLHPGRTIAGWVSDEHGAAIAGAEIAVVDGAVPPVRSDATGRFAISGLGAGQVTLIARAAAYAPAAAPPIAIADRDIAGPVLTLAAGGVARGRVRDPRGAPVAHARVRIAGYDPVTRSTIDREVASDGAGRFEVHGLPRAALVATAFASSYERGSEPGSAPDSEPGSQPGDAVSADVAVALATAPVATVELVVAPAAEITGVVLGPDGEPVPDARVIAVPGGSSDGVGALPAISVAEARRGSIAGAGPEVTTVLRALADDAGRFVVRGAAPGARYELVATGGRGLSPAAPYTVTAGARDVALALIITGQRPARSAPIARADRAAPARPRAGDRSPARGPATAR